MPALEKRLMLGFDPSVIKQETLIAHLLNIKGVHWVSDESPVPKDLRGIV